MSRVVRGNLYHGFPRNPEGFAAVLQCLRVAVSVCFGHFSDGRANYQNAKREFCLTKGDLLELLPVDLELSAGWLACNRIRKYEPKGDRFYGSFWSVREAAP